VFNPDLKIITEKQVTYKQNSITVEVENEANIRTETVIMDSPNSNTNIVTINGEKHDKKGVIIVAIALSILALVLGLLCLRKYVLKSYEDKINAGRSIQMST
jgi:hypothetical protein